MRILVMGAGVLGSYLAHVLIRGGNDVTVLARTKRAAQLQQDGLVIRHYFQRRTTVDQVKVVSELRAEDIYDLIFVVMKYNDFPAVLPALADNGSANIVLVGNNGDTRGMQQFFKDNSRVPQNIAFGFQLNGGIREADGRVICIRAGSQMVLGSLEGEVPFKPLLTRAFRQTKYKLDYSEDINAWLLSHIVPIVAINSVNYLHDFDLSQAAKDSARWKQAVAAMDEGFSVLAKLGIRTNPASLVNGVKRHPALVYQGLKIVHRLPFMKLIDGTFGELSALYRAFESVQQQAGLPTPAWDDLKQQAFRKDALEQAEG
ncbi:ketopantoate reductase family protein [Paenibacillus tritici]|uniref:ketopantoate reductase family protein n=1 Tax=Paenibacillus tritici TaxID=1873425 RepID=UPI001BA4C458|nr:ketopantoate reductase family protein [Paenibacillus tritici]QUL57859.1 ketopantoate reductase family protein [Paenibacillus tritici]